MSGVVLKNVRKAFGSIEVIPNASLSIEPGEFAVFVGPSGCGKSTLLRLVAGLEEATSGTIEIAGRDVTRVEAAERGVAMVFQSYALYPHMTVTENMGFGLKMTGTPKEDVARRVKRAAGILHLEPLLERKPKQLSGGQRQRVAIGRAIVREPKVFLFDEPLSNLDAELRVQMRLEIARLHKELGATMIYVTHDQVEAMTLADKIVVLRAGNVEQVGSPIELYDNPASVFVAGFIGSPRMNFLRGKVDDMSGASLTVSLSDYPGVRVPYRLSNSRAAKGDDILLGVRPEHFRRDGDVKIRANIDVVENLGGTSFAYTRGGENRSLTIDIKDDRSVRGGDELTIGFNVKDAMLFDPRSEARLN
jgi:lactose/L-arabinose transport system ATP-binding protein